MKSLALQRDSHRGWRVGVTALVVLAFILTPLSSVAYETTMRATRLAEPQSMNGMSIYGEIYPGVPVAGMRDPAADLPDVEGEEYVHLACHIRARPDNLYGFRSGDWVPNLRVRFTLTNRQTGKALEGDLYSLLDRGGPHYGINVRMLGAGDYTLVFFAKPPSAKQLARVTGPYAGVPEWFEPFSITVQFSYDPSEIFDELAA